MTLSPIPIGDEAYQRHLARVNIEQSLREIFNHQQAQTYLQTEGVRTQVSTLRSGFQSARLLIDRAGNKIIGVSFWDSEADVAGLMSSGFYQEQVAKFAALFAGPPEREVYEVAVEV